MSLWIEGTDDEQECVPKRPCDDPGYVFCPEIGHDTDNHQQTKIGQR